MAVPTVSIIVPAYNHAAYLGKTITSALEQTWQDFELIVVDDGSSDNTTEVAAQFGAAITYIRQENRGMAGCRNTGIRHARGEFISFLDDDDLWKPEYLSVVIPFLRKNPQLAACHTGSQMIDGEGNLLPQINTRVVPSHQMYDALIDGGFFPPCSVTVRRTCLEAVGLFDEALQGYADWDLWLRISQRHGFGGIPQVLVFYRVHGGGLSSNILHMFTDSQKAIAKHFGPLEGDPQSWPQARRRACAGANFIAALGYFQRNDGPSGNVHLSRAFQIYPQIAKRLDVFYELACAYQPRGVRGTPVGVDLGRSEQFLVGVIAQLFEAAEPSSELQELHSMAWGNAYLALAMLSDQAGDWGAARRYIRQAIKYHPTLLRSGVHLRRLFKLHAGQKVVKALRPMLRFGGAMQ